MKRHCQRYFEEITPDKEQKNKIYECIIKNYDMQNNVEVRKKRTISVRSVLSAAAITAGMGAAAFLIVTHFPFERTPQINTTSESEQEKLSYNESNLTPDKLYSQSADIQNVFCNKEKLVVIYSLDLGNEHTEPDDIISADISTYINDQLEPVKGKISFTKSGNMCTGEMVYDIAGNKSKGEYNIRSELSNIQTDDLRSLMDDTEVSCTKSVSECDSNISRYDIKPLGNLNDQTNNKKIKAFAEITPFDTTITLPGYEDYNIEVSDQFGNVLSNLHDNVYEPLNTDTSLLGIVAENGTDRQYFSVSAHGWRISEYSGGKNMISKNTVNALSVLDEYNGIYYFDKNKKYTELSDYFTAHPQKLTDTGTETYADSMFSSVSGTDPSDKLSVKISDSQFMNALKHENDDTYYRLSEIIKSLKQNNINQRFAVLSVTYEVKNNSDGNADFYFYGGHPVMKSFTESFEDPDIISSNTICMPTDVNYPDKQFSLQPGQTQQIVLGYVVPAETLSIGFYISATNNNDYILMDTK